MNQESLIRIKQIVGKIARENKLVPKAPLPVFDSTGTMIGVSLTGDKIMGGEPCEATATFTFNPTEAQSEATIRLKAETAAQAIRSEVLVTIRPKARQQKVG